MSRHTLRVKSDSHGMRRQVFQNKQAAEQSAASKALKAVEVRMVGKLADPVIGMGHNLLKIVV